MAQSINPGIKTQKLKLLYVEEWIAANSIHVFALTGTHLNDWHFEAELEIRDFTAIRVDWVGRRKGDVAVFLNDTFGAATKDIFINGY